MTKLYHASPTKFRDSIRKTGLKANNGRCGIAVYMVFCPEQAHKIGLWHCDNEDQMYEFDIWSVDIDQKKHKLHVETHPGWCKMTPFKEVMVPESLTGPNQLKLEEDLETDMHFDDLKAFALKNSLGNIEHLFL